MNLLPQLTLQRPNPWKQNQSTYWVSGSVLHLIFPSSISLMGIIIPILQKGELTLREVK